MRKKAVACLLTVLAVAGAAACSSDAAPVTPAPDAAPVDAPATMGDERRPSVADAALDRGAADDGGARASDASGEASAADGEGSDAMSYAVCLADTSPTFANLRTNLFPVSCTSGSLCHGTAAATSATLRGGGGLDLESDVYVHLLGPDGQGAPAINQEGAAHGLIRVKPGDPDNSFLLIKLQLMTNTDNNFGSGMPFPTPGSVCPSTLSTIRTWIAEGAADN